MSEKYDEYIKEHRNNVYTAFCWLRDILPEIFNVGSDNDTNKFIADCEYQCRHEHDKSKFELSEYEAYDNYFYGNRSYEVVEQFNRAWLLHIHRNPHHWQYWILINDDPDEGEKVLDMPDIYIIEMICDWMSFSIKAGDLEELFKWYDQHSKHMKLSLYTQNKVNDILQKIKEKVEKGNNIFEKIEKDNNISNE